MKIAWIREYVGRVSKAQVSMLAAGLAYFATFSLIPLLLLAVAGFGFALSRDPMLKDQVLGFLNGLIANALPDSAGLIGQTVAGLQNGVLDRFKLNAGVSGLIGFISLAWAASGFFAVLQSALNATIPGVRTRGIVAQRAVALSLLGLFGPMVLILMLLGGVLSSASAIPGFVGVRSIATTVLGVVGASLSFVMLFRLMPAQTPSWRSVLVAAPITAIAWQIMRNIISFINPFANFEQSYGLLSGFLLLLAWLYFSMYVLLLGAVLVSMLQPASNSVAETSKPQMGTNQQTPLP